MKAWKIFVITILSVIVATSVFAKEKKAKIKDRADRITTAQETLAIVLAKDILDPDKPKYVREGNAFSASVYSKKSLAWNSFTEVEKLNSGVGGYVFRLAVDEPGVEACLEELQYWPGVNWYQPIKTSMKFQPQPNIAYEFTAPVGSSFPRYRISLRKGDKVIYIPLKYRMFASANEFDFISRDCVDYKIDDMEPMSHLLRVYAYWTAMKGEDVRNIRTLYWRTIATSWSMVMSTTAPLDEDGYYHSTEWFFDEFAYALFPGIHWPDLRKEDHVIWFEERPEPYVIRRRTFDINGVKFVKQWREGEQLVVALKVKRDRGDRIVHIYMTPADSSKHPFAWKVEKGVIQ